MTTTLRPSPTKFLALLALLPFAACSTSGGAPAPGTEAALHDSPTDDAGAAADASTTNVTASTIRIAAGEPSAFTDVHGNVWAADTAYSGGVAYTIPSPLGISGTDAPQLYNSERYGDGAGFTYAFAIAPGAYVVTLKFAEVYVTGPGQRLFNVAIDGQSVLSDFDIYASAGGMNAAIDETFPVTIGSGARIQIDFTPGSAQNPKVDAIEIVPAGGTMAPDGGTTSTCAGETCSGNGQCQLAGGSSYCQCGTGYYPSGMTCQWGSPDVTVDGTSASSDIDTKSYGVDCPDCLNPATTANPAFVSMLKEVTAGKGLIRLHGWGMVTQGSGQCWLRPDGSWDAPKIKAALAPLVQAGFPLLINIPAGPGGDGDTNADTLAAMGASLARIVNVDNHFGIKYIELPNEQENTVGAAQMAALRPKLPRRSRPWIRPSWWAVLPRRGSTRGTLRRSCKRFPGSTSSRATRTAGTVRSRTPSATSVPFKPKATSKRYARPSTRSATGVTSRCSSMSSTSGGITRRRSTITGAPSTTRSSRAR